MNNKARPRLFLRGHVSAYTIRPSSSSTVVLVGVEAQLVKA